MHVVLVKLQVKPEFVAEFRQLVMRHAKNSLGEAGCQRFDVSYNPDDDTQCLLYEQYDDEAAFNLHTQADYFAKFGAAIEDHLTVKDLTCWQLQPAT